MDRIHIPVKVEHCPKLDAGSVVITNDPISSDVIPGRDQEEGRRVQIWWTLIRPISHIAHSFYSQRLHNRCVVTNMVGAKQKKHTKNAQAIM